MTIFIQVKQKCIVNEKHTTNNNSTNNLPPQENINAYRTRADLLPNYLN